MRRMAGLALVATTPLTNAACDPATGPAPYPETLPSPTCRKSPASWEDLLRVTAVWGADAGERIVLLTVANEPDTPWLQTPASYAVEGGTLLPPKSKTIRIKPDAGATQIRLTGTITCHTTPAPMTIVIDLLPRNGGTADDDPTVELNLG